MNEQQAIALVRSTLEDSFEKARFIPFIKNLLNHVENDGFPPRRGSYIPDKFEPYIHSFERIGTYSDGENRIDILIVHLKKETSIERARSMQRNFVAGYLQGSYGSSAKKHAALVAFVSPSSADWRFSLVKLDYRFVEKDGKAKVKEEFTPARRWSFLVGAHEKSHTAQRQLVPIMQDDVNNPTLADLEKRFDIETVSDEFFLEYRGLFIRTKQALDQVLKADPETRAGFAAKGINTVDFAKKLLGQIIFLYYLQKKGWFGVPRKGEWGDGSKDFLRELFAKQHGGYQNFFNDILEPLFYDALRNDRSHDDHYYRLFNCNIPFLNGGLFDPIGNYDWVNTDLTLPNALFSNNKETQQGDTGDGILDIFDRYNFTVREDEPYEKEVAIDPELLGKAYEKFNAIRPDNFDDYLEAVQSGKKGDETKFNKQYGVYYTPREIVHYMCQQSLIQYLHTALNEPVTASFAASEAKQSAKPSLDRGEIASDSALATKISQEDLETLILHGERIKEHDARVVAAGRETKDYPFLMPASIRANAARIDQKLAAITVCDPAVGSGAFPVGMMTEIVKARDVLSTYLQTPSPASGEGWGGGGVYTFKRACIEHSLYGVDIDPGAVEIAKLRLWLSLVVDEDDIHNIKPLPNLDYKIVCGNSLVELVSPEFLAGTANLERNALVAQLKTAKDELFNLTHPGQKEQKRAQIETLIQQLFENYKTAEIRKLEAKIQGIRGQQGLFADAKISKADQKKLQTWEGETSRLQAMQLPGPTEHFEWHINFSEIFENDGFDVVIANPPYVFTRDADFSREFKEHIAKNYFSFLTSKSRKTKANQSGKINLFALFIMMGCFNCRTNGNINFIVPNNLLRTTTYDLIRKFLLENTKLEKIIDLGGGVFDNVTASTIIIAATKSKKVLGHNVEVITNIADIEKQLYSKSRIEQAQFLKNVSYTFNIFADESLYELIRKITTKRTLLGIYCDDIIEGIVAHKYLITGKPTKNTYPLIEGKTINRYGLNEINKHIKWNVKEIHRTRPDYLWETPKKIIIQRISGGSNPLSATLDIDRYKTFASVNNLILKHNHSHLYEFFLGLLNSRILNWYYANNFSNNSKLTVNISKTFLENLPIELGDSKIQSSITRLVERALKAKRTNPQADTSALEAEIDRLVYQLYGLTEDEIKIVEGKQQV